MQSLKSIKIIFLAFLFLFFAALFCNIPLWVKFFSVMSQNELAMGGGCYLFWKTALALFYGIALCLMVHHKTLLFRTQRNRRTPDFYKSVLFQTVTGVLFYWLFANGELAQVLHNFTSKLFQLQIPDLADIYFRNAFPLGNDSLWAILAGASYVAMRFLFDKSIVIERKLEKSI